MTNWKGYNIWGRTKKKVDTCEAQWGNFLWKLLNFWKCNTKSCPPTQKEPFSLSSRLLSIFFWALFDVMLWGCRRHDFSKDVTRKHFFTAWLLSILISHVQNLFDENIFLPFQVQKNMQVCARKESILFTNNAMITRTSCAREQKKVTCPNAQCVARAKLTISFIGTKIVCARDSCACARKKILRDNLFV